MNDSLIIITSDQLKTANLIFLEYSKEKTINTELEKQIHNYKILYNNELIQDSLYQICIQDLSELTKQQNDTIQSQKQTLTTTKKKLKIWRYVGIGGIVLCCLCAL